MSAQTPLLQNNPSTTATSSTNPTHHQLFTAIVISFAWAFDSQQTFINVFTDSTPPWHCTKSTCSPSPTPCGLPADSWSWNRPARTSIVSEWSLHCSSFTTGLPASSYFIGCLLGGLLLSTLADSKLGRKNMLLLSCFTMSVSAFTASFSPNLSTYSILRFLCGLGRSTVGTNALVLSTEIVEEKHRDRVSIAGFFFFSVGFLSLPLIAYTERSSSWRNIYLWTSIPSLLYTVLIYFVAEESPRWRLVHERGDNADTFSTLKTLREKKWATKRLLSVMMAGFGVGMVYYGMPLNLGSLGSNLYTSVAFNALAELPSSLIIFFLVGKIDRRSSLMVMSTVSGVLSLLCVCVEKYVVAVEVASFFCACTAFNVLLIYSVELFPTCVRNSAVGMVRQALVFGGVFAPLLVAEGRGYSFGVFGVAIGFCGVFVCGLPETRGSGISNTIEEEECKQSMSSYVL